MKTNHLRSAFLVTLVSIALIFFPACQGQSEEGDQAEATQVLAILPLTGPSADLGQSVANGMKMAEEDMNQSSSSQKFDLIVEDSEGSPSEAVTVYQSSMAQNQPNVVLSWMSSVASALSPATMRDSVALFVGAALPGLTNETGLVVRVWPKAEHIGEAMGEYAARQEFERIATLYIDDEYGQSVAEAFANVVKKEGKEVVAEEPLALDATDFRSTIERVKTENPGAIYMPAYGAAYVHGLRQVREIFGDDITIMADLPLLSSFTLPQLGNEVENVIVTSTALDTKGKQLDRAEQFAERYRERFERDADFNSGLGYMMFKIAAKGIASSDGSGPSVAQYISTTGAFEGPLGTIAFNSRNDCDIPIQIAQIKNKKPKPLTPLSRRNEEEAVQARK